MKMTRRELIATVIIFSIVIAVIIKQSKNLWELGIWLIIAFGGAFAIGLCAILGIKVIYR